MAEGGRRDESWNREGQRKKRGNVSNQRVWQFPLHSERKRRIEQYPFHRVLKGLFRM